MTGEAEYAVCSWDAAHLLHAASCVLSLRGCLHLHCSSEGDLMNPKRLGCSVAGEGIRRDAASGRLAGLVTGSRETGSSSYKRPSLWSFVWGSVWYCR